MNNNYKILISVFVFVFFSVTAYLVSERNRLYDMRSKTLSKVSRIAEQLDSQTDEKGYYIKGETLERDAYGTLIQVNYSQGGTSEVISVRSAGYDKIFYTEDDIVEERISVNAKGLGVALNSGIKDLGNSAKNNAEEFSENATKGATRGVISAIKEELHKRKEQKEKEDAEKKKDSIWSKLKNLKNNKSDDNESKKESSNEE